LQHVVAFLLLRFLRLQVSLLLLSTLLFLMFLLMLVSLHVPAFQASLLSLFLQLQLVSFLLLASLLLLAFLLFHTSGGDNIFIVATVSLVVNVCT
jgi:hypothetical protein